MSFLAVGWLVVLLPIAAIAWQLRRGSEASAPVTAAFLWPKSTTSLVSRGRRRWPPADARWLLLAAALAVIALAGPVLRRESGGAATPSGPQIRRIIARETGDRVDVLVEASSGVATVSSGASRASSKVADGVPAVIPIRRDGQSIEVRIDDGGQTARASIVRSPPPRLVADGSDPTLARVAEAYARANPDPGGAIISLTTDREIRSPAIRFAPSTRPLNGPRSVARDAPIVGAEAATFPAVESAISPGFREIAAIAGRPVVGVREEGGARQVWLAIDLKRPTPATLVLIDRAVGWVAGRSLRWSDYEAPQSGQPPAATEGIPITAALDAMALASIVLCAPRVRASRGAS